MSEEKFTAEQMRDLLTETRDAVEALEEKVDKIISGETPATTQLTGSKMENYGKLGDSPPDASTVPIGATFTIVDGKFDKNWISDGTKWEAI